MTYTELVAQIQSYTENEYSTVDVNTFITQAENRIFNGVNLPDLRANSTGTITGGNKRSEEHTSELQSQSTSSYAVFCLKKKK
mgnify:CR=1 FL=1